MLARELARAAASLAGLVADAAVVPDRAPELRPGLRQDRGVLHPQVRLDFAEEGAAHCHRNGILS